MAEPTDFDLWLEFEHIRPEPGDDPTDDFANVQVRLPDGRRYSLNVCPFRFSFSLFRSREAGEWVNYSFDVKEGREYQMTLTRQQYRMEWPMRGLVLLDGKSIGDWEAGAGNRLAVLSKIRLPQGRHRLTLISACTYGVWSEAIEVAKSR